MRCEQVRRRLPGILDDGAHADEPIIGHVETCLSCQAELARYRRLLRLLAQLRLDRPSVPDGFVSDVLESIEGAAERRLIRSALGHRRIASAFGLGLSVALAGGILVLARARHSAGALARHEAVDSA